MRYVEWGRTMAGMMLLAVTLLAGISLTGCRTDDYMRNPSYYAAPGTSADGGSMNAAYAPIYTAQDSAPLYAPQPVSQTGPNAPVTNGVVVAGTTQGVGSNAAFAVPPGYTAYTCVPTQVMMCDGYGRCSVGVVQMLQPVGTVSAPPGGTAAGAAAGTSDSAPALAMGGTSVGTGTGGVVQVGYTVPVTDPATTIQPLADYPGYGTMQTPGGIALVTLPPSTEPAAGGATVTDDVPLISGSTLVPPIPAGY